MRAYSLSCVQLFVTPWTVAHQALLSMGILQARTLECIAMPFSRGFFPPQGSNSGLLHCRRILYQLSHKGSPSNGDLLIIHIVIIVVMVVDSRRDRDEYNFPACFMIFPCSPTMAFPSPNAPFYCGLLAPLSKQVAFLAHE